MRLGNTYHAYTAATVKIEHRLETKVTHKKQKKIENMLRFHLLI